MMTEVLPLRKRAAGDWPDAHKVVRLEMPVGDARQVLFDLTMRHQQLRLADCDHDQDRRQRCIRALIEALTDA